MKSVEDRKKLLLKKDEILAKAETWRLGTKSKELLKRALEVESLGNLAFGMFEAPPIIEKAESDAVVYDVDGKAYLDMIAGFAVHNVGHHRSEVLKAIIEQFNKIVQYAEMLNEVRIKLSEKLVKIVPGNFKKKTFYALTGSEANEIAIKLARLYTGRPLIMTQWGDYHGRLIGVTGLTHTPQTWAQAYPVPPFDVCIVRFFFPYCYRCPFGLEYPECDFSCLQNVEYMLRVKEYHLGDPIKGYSNVAAMIIEPYQSAAGYIIPPDEYLPELYKIAKENDILFIVDEIQTGWARTGKMWAIQHYGNIEPDLFLVAKSIANGLPYAAVIGKAEIMDSWGPGAHSSTFAGYFLGAAAALATINIMEEENMAEQAAKKGEYFLKGLKELEETHEIVGNVQGKGLYIGLEFVRNKKTKEPASQETVCMTMRLLQKGLLVKKAGYFGNRFAISPPLTITHEQIDRAIEIFDEVFKEAEQKFGIQKNE